MSKTAEPDLVWRALGDPTRREILDLLREGPKTTGDICSQFPHLCRTAVMKHLDLLTDAALVLIRREGRHRFNYLNPVPIREICERWVRRHIAVRASAMLALKRHVEKPHAKPRSRKR
jgi:DNA-binding transcriptional ArsR family regulator